jgi:FSR family fosmidomycin resistance protein-like MFS transporter
MINDIMQSMISSIYPMLKTDYALDFWQIGMLTLAFQCTASLLQPIIGIVTDKKPYPYSLPVGMGSTLIGLFMLAGAHSYSMLIVASCLIGIGSAVFHPESSRVARLASGGRYGFAQATFQVGGNFGQSIGPLLAAFIIVPNGQGSVAWFSIGAMIGILVLAWVARWYKAHMLASKGRKKVLQAHNLPKRTVAVALAILALLTFSKNAYMASIGSYYTFFVIERFAVSVQQSQIMLFIFLGAVALGTVVGDLSATGSVPRSSFGSRSSACCPSRSLCPMPTCRLQFRSRRSSASSWLHPSRQSSSWRRSWFPAGSA